MENLELESSIQSSKDLIHNGNAKLVRHLLRHEKKYLQIEYLQCNSIL